MRASADCSSGVYDIDCWCVLGGEGIYISWSSSGESSVADVDTPVQVPGTDMSASLSPGAVAGMKPVQQMSLWNNWPTSVPPHCDAGVRVGWNGA